MPVPWVLYAVQSIMSFAIHKTLPGVTIAHHFPYVRGLEAIGCRLLLLLVSLRFAPRLGPSFRTHIGLVIYMGLLPWARLSHVQDSVMSATL